jgi:hypothetical protein
VSLLEDAGPGGVADVTVEYDDSREVNGYFREALAEYLSL